MSDGVGQDEAPTNSRVPCLKVDTGRLPRQAALELWQEEFVPHWEIRPRKNGQERFESATDSYLIGDAMLGTVRTPAQQIDRSRYRIARDGFTQYGFQFVIDGAIGRRDGGREAAARKKGDLFVSDLAQPQALEASDLSALYFSVPRHLLAPLLKEPDHHNQRLLSGHDRLTSLLFDHLVSVYRLAPQMESTEAKTILKPTVELAAAVLNAAATRSMGDAGVLATTQAIRSYIDRHIDHRLSVEAIAKRFGISRRKLYYLFEPFGGVAAYVQDKRLRRAYAAIIEPAMLGRSLATIARDSGFDHYPSFVRAFRRLYDMSPREVRALALEQRFAAPSHFPHRGLHRWLLRTR